MKIFFQVRLWKGRAWNSSKDGTTAIMRTICAFANDFEDEGSGYIIIGAEETDGKLLRPVLGFNSSTLEHSEQELLRIVI